MDISPSPEDPGLGKGRITALEPLYAEICKAHDSITDFRGKLLALVPSLSAVAFTLFIGTGRHFDQRLLLPVGIFGLAVSLGLFCYELRGMFLCHELRDRGGDLERAMQQSVGDETKVLPGHFFDRTEKNEAKEAFKLLKEYSLISVPTASFLVYGSVILGWLVVAGFGIAGFLSAASA